MITMPFNPVEKRTLGRMEIKATKKNGREKLRVLEIRKEYQRLAQLLKVVYGEFHQFNSKVKILRYTYEFLKERQDNPQHYANTQVSY